MKLKLTLAAIMLSAVAFGQLPGKGLLMFDLSGGFSTNEDEVDQGFPTYTRSWGVSPAFSTGLLIKENLFAYLTLGYSYQSDTLFEVVSINNRDFLVQESMRYNTPSIGLGFKRFFPIGGSQIYITTDIYTRFYFGGIKGDLSYKPDNNQIGPNPSTNLVAEGDQFRAEAGFKPGLAVLFNERWFADISLGFLGFRSTNNNLKYSDGFDRSQKSKSIELDLSASTIALKLGYFF